MLHLGHELLAAQVAPLLLGVVHVTDESLNLGGLQLGGGDMRLTCGDLGGSQLTCLLGLLRRLRHYEK